MLITCVPCPVFKSVLVLTVAFIDWIFIIKLDESETLEAGVGVGCAVFALIFLDQFHTNDGSVLAEHILHLVNQLILCSILGEIPDVQFLCRPILLLETDTNGIRTMIKAVNGKGLNWLLHLLLSKHMFCLVHIIKHFGSIY